MNRKELPRCQVKIEIQPIISSEYLRHLEPEVRVCGEPAVAVWQKGEKKLYVCERHDEWMKEKQKETD